MTYSKINRPYLTSHQVAKMFMVTPVTVRQWVQKGLLKGMNTAGGHLRFTQQQIELFAKKRGVAILPLENGTTHRILIVDDDADHCQALTNLLTNAVDNIEIEAAHDGFEAGWKAQTFKPQVILLDLMMPGLDGYEVCRWIKASPVTSHIRIIAMTGYSAKMNSEKIITAGAEECLSKPIDITVLMDAVGLCAGAESMQSAG